MTEPASALSVAPQAPRVPAELRDVAAYVAESLAPATRKAYRSALRAFAAWCEAEDLEALPATPETVARFLAAQAGRYRVATLEQRLAAIRWAHETQGLDSPTAAKGVRSTMRGIRRALGVAPQRKAPATVDRLAAMTSHADTSTLKGLRDRALLLFGFASALRRSELVALTVADLELTERGLLVTLRRSKSDQAGHGHTRAVPLGRSPELCPVRALGAWLEAAGIAEGPVFRSVDRHGKTGERLQPRAVGEVVKLYARRAGLEASSFGGHSLRAGFVTSAAEKGARAERIADHTGHRSLGMIRVYTRRADAFADHAGAKLL
ncbi:MAG: tyrosine-type recombinase/integrase [Kiloniellaceae bacterium]